MWVGDDDDSDEDSGFGVWVMTVLGLEVGVGEGVEAWVCRGLWLRWWWWWWGFRFGVGGLWVVGQGFGSAHGPINFFS